MLIDYSYVFIFQINRILIQVSLLLSSFYSFLIHKLQQLELNGSSNPISIFLYCFEKRNAIILF